MSKDTYSIHDFLAAEDKVKFLQDCIADSMNKDGDSAEFQLGRVRIKWDRTVDETSDDPNNWGNNKIYILKSDYTHCVDGLSALGRDKNGCIPDDQLDDCARELARESAHRSRIS
jgi:hypothetical protein